jgi:hypothetical protein
VDWEHLWLEHWDPTWKRTGSLQSLQGEISKTGVDREAIKKERERERREGKKGGEGKEGGREGKGRTPSGMFGH